MAAPRTTHPHHRSRAFVALIAAGVTTVVALAGCTSTASSAAGSADSAVMTAAAEAAAAPTSAAAAGSSAAGAAPAAPEPPRGDQTAPDVPPQASAQRSVIRTADLRIRLEVPDPGAVGSPDDQQVARERDQRSALATAVASARTTVGGLGGFVASATDDDGRAELTLRVPTGAFDQARDSLATLGTVTSSTETSTDVTAELVDGQSRVDTMTASVARVRQLLAEAEAIGDVLAIESELTTREAELESWQRQVAALSGQVDLATITVGITAVVGGSTTTVAEPPSNAFVTGLAGGWDAFTALFTGVAAAIGALLPFLPMLLIAGWATWWLLRRRSGRPVGGNPRPAAPVTE